MRLHGVHHTAYSAYTVVRSQVMQSKVFKQLGSVHNTAESDSAVYIVTWGLTPWSAPYR